MTTKKTVSAGPGVLGHPRVHDADLCERIRVLEREVEQLKRERHHCGHWCWHGTTHYPYGTTQYPYFTWSVADTSSNTFTTSTTSAGNEITFNG